MKAQKIANLIKNKVTQPYKYKTKNWNEINEDSCKTCNTNSQIKVNTTMLKSQERRNEKNSGGYQSRNIVGHHG